MRQFVFGIVTMLFVVATPGLLAAQSSYFTDFPKWSSDPTNPTSSVAVGDVDGDGDLDLVCGINNGRNK